MTKVVSLATERAKRDAQVDAELGFEISTRPGTVELVVRTPDGKVITAYLDPDQASELGADLVAAAIDALPEVSC